MEIEVSYIILGWLFGILSPSITSRISDYYKKDALEKIVIEELKDLKMRLVLLPFRISTRYGIFDKKLFIWTKTQAQDIKEIDPDGAIKKSFAELDIENNSDLEEFLSHYNSLQKKDEPAFNFKKMGTSVIDSNLINIGILDSELLAKLLEIKFQINAFNQETQSLDEYLIMTFDSSITDTNQKIIKKEIENKNLWISEKAMYIVEKINHVVDPEN